jgi:hypothetical protein
MGQKLSDMAQEELTDKGRIKEELMRLQLQFELDERLSRSQLKVASSMATPFQHIKQLCLS